MKLMPSQFQLEETSMWRFPARGDWATHKSTYRGNWSPYVPRNLLLRYTKSNEIVLDPFIGRGTTAVEALLLKRRIIGLDINPQAIEKTRQLCQPLAKLYGGSLEKRFFLKECKAQDLSFIKKEFVDFVCLHPPYADVIKYSNDIKGDLSLMTLPTFYETMKQVAAETYRVLKKKHYCALQIGDVRRHGYIEPLGMKLMQIFMHTGFKLKEVIIKEQFNCKKTFEWRERARKNNFFLLAHEYIFVFYK